MDSPSEPTTLVWLLSFLHSADSCNRQHPEWSHHLDRPKYTSGIDAQVLAKLSYLSVFQCPDSQTSSEMVPPLSEAPTVACR